MQFDFSALKNIDFTNKDNLIFLALILIIFLTVFFIFVFLLIKGIKMADKEALKLLGKKEKEKFVGQNRFSYKLRYDREAELRLKANNLDSKEIFDSDSQEDKNQQELIDLLESVENKKSWANATDVEKLVTKEWVEKQKDSQQEDLQKLQDDQEFFSWALSKAENSEY